MSGFRDDSKKSYLSDGSLEHINAGSLQRIADATEKMAQRHTELISERDSARRQAEHWRDRGAAKDRQIAALRGQITKLRKRLEK